jgi:hypothetical protein
MKEFKHVISEKARVLCKSAGLAINQVKLQEKNNS